MALVDEIKAKADKEVQDTDLFNGVDVCNELIFSVSCMSLPLSTHNEISLESDHASLVEPAIPTTSTTSLTNLQMVLDKTLVDRGDSLNIEHHQVLASLLIKELGF